MCEFDIHIDCAVKNIGGGVRIDSAVSGWNKKLFSPLRKHSTINGKKTMMELGLQETELITSTHSVSLEILDGITPLRDKMTPLSDDTSPLASSNQFSDSYFSIDLNKSYSTNHDRRGQVRKEVNNDYISQSVVSSNSGQGDEDTIGVVDYWLKNHSHKDKVNNTELFKGGSGSDSSQKVLMKNPKERLAKGSAKDQTTSKAETVSSTTLNFLISRYCIWFFVHRRIYLCHIVYACRKITAIQVGGNCYLVAFSNSTDIYVKHTVYESCYQIG